MAGCSMTQTPELLEVIQADWDAVEALCQDGIVVDYDGFQKIAQAFARHRIEHATPSPGAATDRPTVRDEHGNGVQTTVDPSDRAGLAASLKRIAWKSLGGHYTMDGVDALNAANALAATPSPVEGRGEVDCDALTRLIFPAAAAAWDREIQYGLDKGQSRAGAIDDALAAMKNFRPEVNWPECRDRVRKSLAALPLPDKE
jgi:hypothetical protein